MADTNRRGFLTRGLVAASGLGLGYYAWSNLTRVGHDLTLSAAYSEWAGVCFSRDGKWIFANIYNPGVTVAITGPWAKGPV